MSTDLDDLPVSPPSPEEGKAVYRLTVDSRFLLAGVLFVGVVFMFVYHVVWADGHLSTLIHGDERSVYLPFGVAIVDQGLSWFLEPDSLSVGPLNPLWIALLGARVVLVKLANIGLFVVTGVLMWDLARRMFGNVAALIGVAMFATFIPFYRFMPTLLTEPLFVFLLVAGVWVFLRFDPTSIWAPVVAGCILGLATLTRPSLQLFPLFLIVVWLILRGLTALLAMRSDSGNGPDWLRKLRNRFSWVQSVSLRPLLLLALGLVIVVAPYVAKNVVALDEAAIKVGSGTALYIGNNLRTNGDTPAYSDMRWDVGETARPHPRLSPEGDKLITEAAVDRIRRNTMDVVLLQPEKAMRMVFGSKDHFFYPQDEVVSFARSASWFKRLRIWDMVLTAIVAVFGLIGLFTLRMPPRERLVIGSLIVYFIVSRALLFALPRYLVPVFPFLMMLAAAILVSRRRVLIVGGAVASLAIVGFISFEGALRTPDVSEHYTSYFDTVVPVDVNTQVVATNDLEEIGGGRLEITGDDPYLVISVLQFEGATNQVVFVTISGVESPSTDAPAVGQLYWREADGSYSGSSSTVFDVVDDDEERIYRVSPSFTKPDLWIGLTLTEIRLDIPPTWLGGSFELIGVQIKR